MIPDDEPTLKSAVWALALVRRAEVGGAFAHVVRRGDDDAGVVLVKVVRPGGFATLYGPARDGQGRRVRIRLAGHREGETERDVDEHLARRLAHDPDLWVVEIEDVQGRHFLDERVD
jgi:hypothetical protein